MPVDAVTALSAFESQRSNPNPTRRSRGDATRRRRPGAAATQSRNALRAAVLQSYGYHNTFHTHAPSGSSDLPPSYEHACRSSRNRNLSGVATGSAASRSGGSSSSSALPSYDCTIEYEGPLGLKTELFTPFKASYEERWQDIYTVLRGTQLCLYRLKTPHILAKNRSPVAGRLIKSYSLQHAEVGLAVDFRKTDLVPKSALAKLIPESARHKVYITDPHLFEPVREHVLRLRVETEQILLCAGTAAGVLTWIEKLCAAIDISQPIEDRSEPRYRTLPRRSRRQRNIEAAALDRVLISGDDNTLTRMIAQQERLFQRLYPHLANSCTEANGATGLSDTTTPIPQGEVSNELELQNADPEAEDLDRFDVTAPNDLSQDNEQTRPSSAASNPNNPQSTSVTSPDEPSAYDPKTARPCLITQAGLLRFRRRCAPMLLEDSPRASDVIFSKGLRWRIDWKRGELKEFKLSPPHYEVGNWKGDTEAEKNMEAHPGSPAITITSEVEAESDTGSGGKRPDLQRGVSIMSDVSIPRTVQEDTTNDVEVFEIDAALYRSYVQLNSTIVAASAAEPDMPPRGRKGSTPDADADAEEGADEDADQASPPNTFRGAGTPSLRSTTSHATLSEINTNNLSPSESRDSISPVNTVGEDLEDASSSKRKDKEAALPNMEGRCREKGNKETVVEPGRGVEGALGISVGGLMSVTV